MRLSKHNLVVILVFLSFWIFTDFSKLKANIPNQGVTNGLVAQWLLNGDANDTLGISPGTAYNIQWVSAPNASGNIQQMAYFNGNSSIVVPSTSNLKITNSAITLSAWIKSDSFNVNNYYDIIFAGGVVNVLNTPYEIRITDQWILFQLFQDNISNGTEYFGSTNPLLQPSKWYLVTTTYDGTNAYGYINGVQYSNSIPPSSSSFPSNLIPHSFNTPLYIGSRDIASRPQDAWFKGYMTDVRIYNRALNSSDIAAQYTIQSSNNPLLQLTGSLTNGLVASLPLQNSANDIINSNNNGTIIGNVYGANNRFGTPNAAFYFDGTYTQSQIAAGNSSTFTKLSNDFTISLWFQPMGNEPLGSETTYGTSYSHSYLIAGSQGGGNSGICIGAGTNGISVIESGNAYLPVVLCYPANLGTNWTHAVLTCSNNGAPVLYVNGVYVRTGLNSGRVKLASFFNGDNYEGIGGGGYGNYRGNVSDLLLYNRPLSSNEVASLYSMESLGYQPTTQTNFYVANAKGLILKGSTTNASTTTFSSVPASPYSMAVSTNGIIYVANPSKNSIYQIGTNGSVSTLATSGLLLPYGVALDPSGNIYAANFGNNSVMRISTNGSVSTYATNGINRPYALAFDASSNLYVANQGNSSIIKIQPNGYYSTLLSGMSLPTGLAVDGSGTVYAADKTRGTITRIVQGGYPAVFAYGLNQPTALSLDPSGTVYAVNSGNNSLVKISSRGISTIVTTNGLIMPISLTIGSGH